MHHQGKEGFSTAASAASRATQVAVACTGYHAFGPVLEAGRFVLPNGLKIVLVPDHRAPIFVYQTWFNVGSKHEDPGRTGLAHLFEHLMFKGTKRFPSGTFDHEMERRGAQTNAATWVDWTHYTEALAARGDNLATVVEFESDRMTGLLIDQETFASELEVVKNERRMSVEDSLVGTLSERLMALIYKVHPYRWPTIGSMAHLEATSIADLETFYRRFYAPNNATVVVVGDLDLAVVLTLLAEKYAAIPSQPVPPPPRVAEPKQEGARHASLSRPMVAPQIMVGYRAPAQNTPLYPALEIVAEALVSGDTARLYDRLVTREQVASEVSGFLAPFAEPGMFEFHITARPDADPERVAELVHEELGRLQSGLSSQEIEKARNGLEVALYETLKDVEGCAEAVGHFETNYGDFALAFTSLEAYAAVTDAQIRRVAAEVFVAEGRCVVVAVPDGTPVEDGEENHGA
jgi:zinc protease